MSKNSPIAVVTGASRGAGQGIAKALGSHGCTVYVTGRSETSSGQTLPGTIYETAEAVTAAGGHGIAVRCDHADDAQVKALFEQVEREQGRLDILVNNAAAIYDDLTTPGMFWEKSLRLSDIINVGARSSYVASYYAAPMMVRQKSGLVIFTSGSGSAHYVYGPGYGAQKAAQDKMAYDMGVDFRDYGVAALSIWMGALLTDRLKMVLASDPEKFRNLKLVFETPEFTGHVIWALFNDPELAKLTGQTVIGAEIGKAYGLTDIDGQQPPSSRDTHGIAPYVPHHRIVR